MSILKRVSLVSGGILALAAVIASAGVWLAAPAQAATFTVTKTADTADGTCDADCSLREAIIAANANAEADIINVPAGTYVLTSGELEITSDITINGAGASSTVVDGNGSSRVFHISDTGATVVINDLTAQNGDAANGGGIENDGILSLTSVAVSGNSGGGINNTGTLSLADSTVDNNSGSSGAGINLTGGGPGNGTLTVSNSSISDNTATGSSGGIHNTGAGNPVTIVDSTVRGNTATTGSGGGITHTSNGTLEISGSTFSGNEAGSIGGAIYHTASGSGAITIVNSTVSGNSAADNGGGIYCTSGAGLDLGNVTLSDNSATSGGGIYITCSDVTLTNTMVVNSASGGDCDNGTPTSLGHNIDSDGSCGFAATGDQPGVDPLLDPLALNAPGSTQTHALLAGSPAIDTADDTACPASDQRGVARPQDGDDDGTAICDVGAFELEPAVPTPTPTPQPAGQTPTVTATATPAELPDTGSPPAADSGVPWLALLAAIGAAAVAGGALIATGRR
ncbi:MAG: right-handed parallel beta-helix repeat-containing protein [Dehalococcoidia bacterium]